MNRMPLQRTSRQADRRWLVVLAALYLAVGIPLAARCVNQLNTDGVLYLLLAEHWAKGEWGAALGGHWSPLLPWLISLPLRVGISPFVAARGILLLSGLGLTFVAWSLFGRLGLSRPLRWAATLAVAAMALDRSVILLTPDLLVAAILSVYFWQSLDTSLVERRGAAFKCGLVAGLAYLAKAYAFPFFVLHFSVLAVVYSRRAGPGAGGRAVRTIALGLAGAAVFVLPWATAISVKYGYPTISTASAGAWSYAGPVHRLDPPALRGLAQPQGKRLNTLEDPLNQTFSYSYWSSFADLASFKHYLRKIDKNLTAFRRFVGHVAHWGIMSGVLFCALLLAIARSTGRNWARPVRWAIWTTIAYASGYILLHAIPRYFMPLEPVLVGTAFLLLQVLVLGAERQRITARGARQGLNRAYLAIALLTVVFLINPVAGIRWHFIHPPDWGNAYVAKKLSSLPLRPPLAASEWFYGLYVSYRLRMKYLGRPASDSPAQIARELRDAGAGTFLVWGDSALAQALDQQPGMQLLATVTVPPEIRPGEVVVFDVLPAED